MAAQPLGIVKEAQVVGAAEAWFSALYAAHHAAVRSVIFRFGIVNDLEDVVQEAFLKAFRGREQFRSESSERTWVIRIAVNAAKDQLKRERTRPSGSADAAETASADQPDAQGEQVRAGLASLSLPLRSALILCGIEGYTVREVASILAVPEGTVKSRLFAAREAMRQYLLQRGIVV